MEDIQKEISRQQSNEAVSNYQEELENFRMFEINRIQEKIREL